MYNLVIMAPFSLILIGLSGWFVGLLINYLADALPAQPRQVHPACPSCKKPLPYDVYLPWPRSCPACARRPGLRAWLAPSLGALGAIAVWLYPIPELGHLLSFLILAYFGLVVVIDIEHRLILFSTTAAGTLIALLAGWLRFGWRTSLLGGLAGLLILFTIYLLGILFGRLLGRLRGQVINEAVFGFGDVLLGGIIGLMLGWPTIMRSLFFTILAAGLFSLVYLVILLILRRYRVAIALPYGPFLILGALLYLYAG